MTKTRTKHRRLTHHLGPWSWDTKKLHDRIARTGTNSCWIWTGTANKHGNLFGAYKDGVARMTQANRIIYMEQSNEDIELVSVTMSCGNRFCCNPRHFELAPNKRLGKQ